MTHDAPTLETSLSELVKELKMWRRIWEESRKGGPLSCEVSQSVDFSKYEKDISQ